jgi:hypothetical protein
MHKNKKAANNEERNVSHDNGIKIDWLMQKLVKIGFSFPLAQLSYFLK